MFNRCQSRPLPAAEPTCRVDGAACIAATAGMKRILGTLRRLAFGALLAGSTFQPVLAQPAPAAGPQPADILSRPAARVETQSERQVTQPLNNAPTWRAVNSGQSHFTTLPANEGGVLIQPAGEQWRQLRNGPVTQWGGWALVAMLTVIVAFYLIRGTIRLSTHPTGRLIERFSAVERYAHWSTAITFVILALTGMLMLFGKHVVLPVFGYSAFSFMAMIAKGLHNFVGPLFSFSIVVTFILFVRDNVPEKGDMNWLMRFGGLLSNNSHLPSGRFNAGEKVWFWGGLTVLGIVMSITGFILDFPNLQQTRGQMQLAWTWHAIAALLFVMGSMGHIYIGTLGMEGAFGAMRTGVVDEAWAKEHHEYWLDDVKAGRVAATAESPQAGDRSAGQQPA